MIEEDYLVAQATRATLGLVSPRVRAAGCRPVGENVELHFAVVDPTPEDLQDIEEIGDNLDTLLGGQTSIGIVVHYDADALDWESILPVYGAKP